MHGKIVYGTQFVAPRLCYAMCTKLYCSEFSSGHNLVPTEWLLGTCVKSVAAALWCYSSIENGWEVFSVMSSPQFHNRNIIDGQPS